jgi:hypothetical protein
MLDVLHHAAYDDVVLGKHRIFHCVKYDVFSVYWLVRSLGYIKPISLNIVNVNIYLIVITIKSVVFCRNDRLFVLIKAMQLVLIFFWLVSISENLLSSSSIIGDNVTKVAILVVL